MSKKSYFIILSLFIITFGVTLFFYLTSDKGNNEPPIKHSEEYLYYQNIFDFELNEDSDEYIITELKINHRFDHTISIPDTIDNIPVTKVVDVNNSFANWKNITKLVIGKNIKYLGTSKTNEGVLEGGTYADGFMSASGSLLTNIEVSKDNPIYSSLNGVLYNKEFTVLIKYPNSLVDEGNSFSFKPLDSVKVIYAHAFYNNKILSKLDLNNCEIVGAKAFYGCTNLTEVNYGISLKELSEEAFYKCNLGLVTLPNSLKKISSRVFAYNIALKSVYVPSSVTDFGINIFSGLPKTFFVLTEEENIEKLSTFSAFKNVTIKAFSQN